jgi:hypothetical protein
MISDVLVDAAAQIRQYLEEQPEVHADVRPEIEAVIAAMLALAFTLDQLPPDDV